MINNISIFSHVNIDNEHFPDASSTSAHLTPTPNHVKIIINKNNGRSTTRDTDNQPKW